MSRELWDWQEGMKNLFAAGMVAAGHDPVDEIAMYHAAGVTFKVFCTRCKWHFERRVSRAGMPLDLKDMPVCLYGGAL